MLGANTFNKDLRGLYLFSMADNPNTVSELADSFGPHAKLANPAAVSADLRSVTVTGVVHAKDPSVHSATGLKTSVNTGDGTFQGYAVNIPGAEWDRLQKGVVYRLVPVNTSYHYRWNVKDTAFVKP